MLNKPFKGSRIEAEQVLAELNQPERITLFCGKHNYVPDLYKAPVGNCPECWQCYLFTFIGAMPPSQRAEVLEALHEFAYKTVEDPTAYQQFDRPEVHIEKDRLN